MAKLFLIILTRGKTQMVGLLPKEPLGKKSDHEDISQYKRHVCRNCSDCDFKNI